MADVTPIKPPKNPWWRKVVQTVLAAIMPVPK